MVVDTAVDVVTGGVDGTVGGDVVPTVVTSVVTAQKTIHFLNEQQANITASCQLVKGLLYGVNYGLQKKLQIVHDAAARVAVADPILC